MRFARNYFVVMNSLADGFEDRRSRIGLAKIACTAGRLHFRALLWIVLSRDKDDGSGIIDRSQAAAQIKSGYSLQLEVQHEAVEMRALAITEKSLGGRVSHGLIADGAK